MWKRRKRNDLFPPSAFRGRKKRRRRFRGAAAFSFARIVPKQKLLRLKHILAETADGANPILRYFFPRRAGGYTVFRIAGSGIILITTGTNVLHNQISFSFFCPALISR